MKGNQFEFWYQALSLLKMRMPQNLFNSIIPDSRLDRFENDKLTIILPFPFMLRRITHSDKAALEAVFSEVIGRPISVEFKLAPESERSKIKKIAAEAQDLIERRKGLLKPDSEIEEKEDKKSSAYKNARHIEIDEDFIPLNPLFTFETFVVGDNSLMAHAAAVAVARRPGDDYNPLFIYSGVGLGKTHILHAIGQYALKLNPSLLVRFITAETFTNELVDAIGVKDCMKQFRSKYRKCDILLIDDIHFLIGKEATQEAFFHTLNTLFELNKQVVITSDRHPRELRTLKERLINRFQLGLVVDIQRPGFETRMAILKRKAELMELEIPTALIEIFAGEVQGSIRSLIGCLNYVKNFEVSHNRKVSFEDAKSIAELCKDDAARKDKPITVAMILDLVCHHYRLTPDEILGPSKSARVSHPRHVGMYLARKHTNLTFKAIAGAFNREDHGTVHHGVNKVISQIDKDAVMSREISYVEDILLGQSPRE